MIGRTNAGGGGSSKMPSYTYTGSCTPITDENGWRLKFFTSGTLTLNRKISADIFCVGGGGAGAVGVSNYGGGGGGGYTTTALNQELAAGTYEIVVGAGAAVGAERGGTTSAFGCSAAGGYSAVKGEKVGGNGGSGGGAAGSASTASAATNVGGSNGSDGGSYQTSSEIRQGGTGQVGSTREFGEDSGTLYAGGGGGSASAATVAGGEGGGGNGGGVTTGGTLFAATDGEAGTGGGGGGFYNRNSIYTAGAGGSGIVVIRNAR